MQNSEYYANKKCIVTDRSKMVTGSIFISPEGYEGLISPGTGGGGAGIVVDGIL